MSFDRSQPVRIGVVGLGSFGRLHALSLAGLAEAELVAVVARRQDSLDAVKDQLPDVTGYTDLNRAIDESGASAWIVASSTGSHVSVTRTLLEAGKPVLLEKPIADNLADAQTLAPLIHENSSNLMMGHILLFNSEFLALRDEVKQRGNIGYIDCVRHRPTQALKLFPGETPFHLLMVHDLYCVLALVDRAEPDTFSAQVHRTADGQIDLALAQLQWNGGPMASFSASFMTPSGMSSDGYDRLEIFGEGWAGRMDANPRPITIWDDRARWPMALEIRADVSGATGMMAQEQRCFCRVVQGQQAVPVGATYEDAMQVQRWLDKLLHCAAAR